MFIEPFPISGPKNSYPRDGPGTYFISGYFGILGFPQLTIKILLSSPDTSDRPGSTAGWQRYTATTYTHRFTALSIKVAGYG
ncbi:hypothetical protein ACN38_g8938 [Penicillium nordicum]|uniref:Uncharacterized protein n=1 Tax=Penicillium nordicum TaxID=229535 RepID=A0A0M9WD06_9EURO|nr:hypothetical protein ACN38_g8938 [Penicillium nordicum]